MSTSPGCCTKMQLPKKSSRPAPHQRRLFLHLSPHVTYTTAFDPEKIVLPLAAFDESRPIHIKSPSRFSLPYARKAIDLGRCQQPRPRTGFSRPDGVCVCTKRCKCAAGPRELMHIRVATYVFTLSGLSTRLELLSGVSREKRKRNAPQTTTAIFSRGARKSYIARA